MRNFPFKPSRRPKAKAARRPQPTNWLGGAYTLLLGLLTATVAAQLLAASLAAMPAFVNVGDRVALGVPARPMAIDLPTLAAAQLATPAATSGRACLLDLQKMSKPGGVFTVLAVRPDGIVLSWAGGQSAGGGAACANSAPIFVTPDDYASLMKTRSLKH